MIPTAWAPKHPHPVYRFITVPTLWTPHRRHTGHSLKHSGPVSAHRRSAQAARGSPHLAGAHVRVSRTERSAQCSKCTILKYRMRVNVVSGTFII